jgi:RNA polymerase sigma-70 factor (ECF subfamily)
MMSTTTLSLSGPCGLASSSASSAGEAEDCLGRLAAGEDAAAAELYDRFGDELYGLALWICGSAPDAADVVQEVFLRLMRSRARLGAVRDARAYLLRMTRSAAIDLHRRRRVRHEPLEERLLAPVLTDPATRVEAQRLSRWLAKLPASQRSAIYLRYFSELSYAEIGRVTGVPTFTAASRCRLGLQRLRRWLVEERRR